MQEIRVFLKQQEAQSTGGVKSFTAGQSASLPVTQTYDAGYFRVLTPRRTALRHPPGP